MSELKRYHARWHRWARFVAQRLLLLPVVRLVLSLTVRGREQLSELQGPFVVVTNHSSHLDAPLIVTTLPYRLSKNLAVNAAADYFYRHKWMKALTSLFFNTFPVHRNPESMESRHRGMALRLLQEGVPIVIFPEATRSRSGRMRRFKSGAASMCVSEGVPCVPMAIIGAADAMPVGRFWPVWGRPNVTVLIGEPMRPELDENPRAFSARMEAQVRAMLETKRADVVAVDSISFDHEEAS